MLGERKLVDVGDDGKPRDEEVRTLCDPRDFALLAAQARASVLSPYHSTSVLVESKL